MGINEILIVTQEVAKVIIKACLQMVRRRRNRHLLGVRVPNLANQSIGFPVKFEFQINGQ